MASPTEESKGNKISKYVKLNVGGMLFHTTIDTLTKFQENMLAAMFSGRMDLTTDEEGWVLIDRSGKHFGVILNFLRDSTVPLPNLNNELAELRAEANYYCISELVELCDQALVGPMNIHDFGPNFVISLVKPLDENDIKSITKPAIILEIFNYKYSSNNIELFDKLAIGLYKKILFIRCFLQSINKRSCRWRFYSNGEQLQEIYSDSDNMPQSSINTALAKLFLTLMPKPEM